MKNVRVGVGVWVWKDGKVLFLQRFGAHGEGTWSTPGGHLEMGETFEECAAREVMEETGVKIKNIRQLAATNDIFGPDKHYITIWMAADWDSGEPQLLEPDKCRNLGWRNPDSLPEPVFKTVESLRAARPELFVKG